ncbi:hypothetical protein MASR2M70_12990 [Bacillota bacterium]
MDEQMVEMKRKKAVYIALSHAHAVAMRNGASKEELQLLEDWLDENIDWMNKRRK